ncbi:MAG: RsmB/NOP family class I SAM-dependent RNA methyltransferase [Gemmatimonadota bacterium]|nr:RsmB/NOP family class I SAM-dependent RNA methyltransferase [Gemmatimonadota bacterium]
MAVRTPSGSSRRARSVDLERYRAIIPDWKAFTDAASREEPTVFRVRAGRVDESGLVERLRAQGFRTRPLDGMPGFHQVEREPYPLSRTFEHWNGLLYLQQASTGVAARALGPRPGERVLDLCSAPGGKTAHLADLMEDSGCLVASEISESRIRGLLGNLYRLGHTNVLTVAADGRAFPTGARFDRVLVDAPCSGEGTLRRRAGKAGRQSRSFLGYVTSAQQQLLERAVELTKPGGDVLYVTCTFAPEENEAIVSRALAELPVELVPLELPVPHAPGLTAWDGARFDPRLEGAARIYPQHLDSGGLFLAKLRRMDDATGTASSAGAGWTSVPEAFPDARDGEGTESLVGGEVDPRGLVTSAMDELGDRFGVSRERLNALSWTVRGGRVWMHSVSGWPLEAWAEGTWRAISIGVRAVEFDSKGRARPTNDALRLLSRDVDGRRVELSRSELRRFLDREPLASTLDLRGPVAVSYDGDVVGRGALTREGLKSEVPKARAQDLVRVLDQGGG